MAHPAKFSKELLPVIKEMVGDAYPVLDPMAGVGTLASVIPGLYMNELEPEWAEECRKVAVDPWHVVTGDARSLPWSDGTFGAIATSPTYGNRMADRYAGDAKNSKRHTYRIGLGRELTAGNTGGMQWGREYRQMHEAIWAECSRVLGPEGILVLNSKNHIREGKEVDVTNWHYTALKNLGLVPVAIETIKTPGQRHGANGNLRLDYEYVLKFIKP